MNTDMDMEALHVYCAQQAQLPQRLGVIDCVTFVAEALKIGWGRDFTYRLAYWDRRSAVRRLRQANGLYEATCEVLGASKPISELQPGDVVYSPQPASLGLLAPGLVLAKGHYTIHRYCIDPSMIGWSTK